MEKSFRMNVYQLLKVFYKAIYGELSELRPISISLVGENCVFKVLKIATKIVFLILFVDIKIWRTVLLFPYSKAVGIHIQRS